MEACHQAYHDAKSRPMLVRIHGMDRDKDRESSEDEALSFEKMLKAMLV